MHLNLNMAKPVLVATGLALGACASTPPVELEAPQAWTGVKSSFAIQSSETAAMVPAESAVRQKLLEQGWQEQTQGADWQVQVSYDERLLHQGLFSDESAHEGQWHEAPRKALFWNHARVRYSLQIQLTPANPVGTAYLSRASVVERAGQGETRLDDLARSVVSPLQAGQ
jgi:hypothetical protein